MSLTMIGVDADALCVWIRTATSWRDQSAVLLVSLWDTPSIQSRLLFKNNYQIQSLAHNFLLHFLNKKPNYLSTWAKIMKRRNYFHPYRPLHNPRPRRQVCKMPKGKKNPYFIYNYISRFKDLYLTLFISQVKLQTVNPCVVGGNTAAAPYTGTFSCLRHILVNEGGLRRGLYRGMAGSLLMSTPRFALIFQVKRA